MRKVTDNQQTFLILLSNTFYMYFLVSKVARKPRRCRGCFVPFFRKKYRSQSATGVLCRFLVGKKRRKNRPADKKAKRRGLTLAPGDYSRVCKQTVPSARAFSPHLFERLFCQAGVVRREKRHADGFGAFNFATLVFLLLARHSPQAVSARAACVG